MRAWLKAETSPALLSDRTLDKAHAGTFSVRPSDVNFDCPHGRYNELECFALAHGFLGEHVATEIGYICHYDPVPASVISARMTEFAGLVAGSAGGALTTSLIRWFVAKYGVDMSEAADPDVQSYKTFNDFFTRPLKVGARPLARADFICPVDGAISQLGTINDHHILQAKGHRFTTTALVGGDRELAATFRHGSFANLYLSPKDYHRLHMPCDGKLVRMIYVPGSLFSVNPTTARGVSNLFARNERVVCVFDSREHGRFVMVLVGATIVGSMATAWHGVVNAKRGGKISEWEYSDQVIALKQGDEMGRFLLGSTIVMLFEQDTIRFNESWAPEQPVRLGESMGNGPG